MSSRTRSGQNGIAIPVAKCLSVLALVVLSGLQSGCASSQLELARHYYYQGEYTRGADALGDIPKGVTGRALMLMERGMLQQARGAYEASTQDWLKAHELSEHLDYLSLSRSSTSLLINDDVLAFRGSFYERVLLHAFAAKSYMALNQWDDAAVEARNIISLLESREAFPDDPYSRYLAGFFLEMTGDGEGAALQYRTASDLLKTVNIDAYSGAIRRTLEASNAGEQRERPRPAEAELVCFISLGRAVGGGRARPENAVYASIYAGDRYLGRSHRLSNVPHLRSKTEKVLKKQKRAKTAARIAIKEAAAELVAQEDQVLGDVLRLLLFALETDDSRYWETLPRDLHVARVPCPDPPNRVRVILHNAQGGRIAERSITAPIVRHGNLYGSFLRVH